MADHPGIANPRMRVVMADGSEFTVQTYNMDMINWDRTSSKHKWPPLSEVPVMWQTFLSWSAARRDGLIPTDLAWEEYESTGPRVALSVFVIQDTPVDPTQAGPAPG